MTLDFGNIMTYPDHALLDTMLITDTQDNTSEDHSKVRLLANAPHRPYLLQNYHIRHSNEYRRCYSALDNTAHGLGFQNGRVRVIHGAIH